MLIANFPSLRKIAVGATLALVVTAALFIHQGESIANHLSAPKATYQNANLGDALPGMLGSGFAPNLW